MHWWRVLEEKVAYVAFLPVTIYNNLSRTKPSLKGNCEEQVVCAGLAAYLKIEGCGS